MTAKMKLHRYLKVSILREMLVNQILILQVKNKQCFKEMSNRNASVWQVAFNASLQSGETKRQNNRIILKCFFKMTFLMIRKNWAHSHNFGDL